MIGWQDPYLPPGCTLRDTDGPEGFAEPEFCDCCESEQESSVFEQCACCQGRFCEPCKEDHLVLTDALDWVCRCCLAENEGDDND